MIFAQRRPNRGPAEARDAGPAAPLGRRIFGDAALPIRDGQLVLPLDRLARHALVLGASGSGKTETLLRLAYSVAVESDWRIFYLDGKGDEETLARFFALMRHAGRRPRAFPRERYDGWRGDSADIANRMIEVIDFAHEGPAAYYRDQATNLIRLCCDAPLGPPRSSSDLLARLRLTELAALYDGRPEREQLAGLTERQLAETRLRYRAFFGALRGRLDGRWAFEDADAGYLLLDGIRLKHDATSLARYLIEDFCQYAVARKPRAERVLLIVDEFSAIARAATALVAAIERIRGAGAAVVVAPQALEGMGGAEAAARIVGSTHIKLIHQVPQPEEIVRVAGTTLAFEPSLEHDQGEATGRGSLRLRLRPKVDPNEVRRLPVGTCFAICEGRAAKVRVERAPETAPVELPAAEDAAAQAESLARDTPAPLRP